MGGLVVTFFATFFIWFLFFGLIILWFVDGKIKKEQVIHALYAVLITLLVIYIFKHFFPTVRPFLINNEEIRVLFAPRDGSFPSLHTATAFALATTIYLHDKKIGSVYLIAALIIGLFRVIANVHYPIDIFGGMLLGSLIALLVDRNHLFKIINK